MKKRMMAALACAALTCLAGGIGAQAAAADSAVSEAYNAAVEMEDNLDGFDVTVKSVVSIAGQSTNAEKEIRIQTSGMQSDKNLQVAIDIQTTDGDKQQYYKDGYFYSNQSGNNLKYAMEQSKMLELLNYYVYLDFDSSYLSMLESKENTDGTVTYSFAASQDTIGNYADKLLEGAQEEHQINIISLQGTVEADASGIIAERKIEMAYTVNSGDQPQICILNSDAVFNSTGSVSVAIPNLSSYSEKGDNEAVNQITKVEQTLYATSDLNVRAQNSVTAAILGGIAAGDAMQETGYTSDGWIQISYNGAVAYVSGDYVSTTKPVIVSAMSGTMYAVAQVNVRASYTTEGAVLGVLSVGEAVSTTGYTNNDWIQISYNGQTAYVYESYLSWDAPYDPGDTAGRNVMNDNNYDPDDTAGRNVMNDNNDDSGYSDEESCGTVIAYGMSAITVALDNGITLSADKDNVSIFGEMYVGAYVLVDYIGEYMYEITAI